jgi:hypothetical protein
MTDVSAVMMVRSEGRLAVGASSRASLESIFPVGSQQCHLGVEAAPILIRRTTRASTHRPSESAPKMQMSIFQNTSLLTHSNRTAGGGGLAHECVAPSRPQIKTSHDASREPSMHVAATSQAGQLVGRLPLERGREGRESERAGWVLDDARERADQRHRRRRCRPEVVARASGRLHIRIRLVCAGGLASLDGHNQPEPAGRVN